MVGLSYGATSLFTTCSVLEIWWLKLQIKSCSEMGVPVLRPPEWGLYLTDERLRSFQGLHWMLDIRALSIAKVDCQTREAANILIERMTKQAFLKILST